jgi:hypothetical protein
LVLKYRTFRNWDEEVSRSEFREEILKTKDSKYFMKYIVKREIKFVVADKEGN